MGSSSRLSPCFCSGTAGECSHRADGPELAGDAADRGRRGPATCGQPATTSRGSRCWPCCPRWPGFACLSGGWRALRWAAPSIAFLFFMIPLPYRVEHALGSPLQRIATLSSTYALQTMGLPAIAEGNVILIGEETRIGVVEACNGLGMLFMFLAYAIAVVLVIRRSIPDKIFLILSAIPIAVLANVIRISATGLLYELASDQVAETVYHDLAGWLMMPLALAAFWLELTLLSHLFLEPEPDRLVPVTLRPDQSCQPRVTWDTRQNRENPDVSILGCRDREAVHHGSSPPRPSRNEIHDGH